MNSGPCKSYSLLLKQLNTHGGVLGMDILNANYSLNTVKFRLFIVLYSLCILSTISSFGDVDAFVDIVFWFVILGFLLQSVIKIQVFLGYRTSFVRMTAEFQRTYLRSMKQPKRRELLDKFVGYSGFAYKVMRCIYYTAGFVFIAGPLVALLLGVRISTAACFLPLLDHKSSPGFEINYVFQSILFYLTTHGLSSSDSSFVVHLLLGMGHLRVIQGMVDDLNELLRNAVPERDALLQEKIEAHIKEIVFEHVEHLR